MLDKERKKWQIRKMNGSTKNSDDSNSKKRNEKNPGTKMEFFFRKKGGGVKVNISFGVIFVQVAK